MTKLYLITFEAEINVQIEAGCEEEAIEKAMVDFVRTDVMIIDLLDIVVLSGNDEEYPE